MIEAGVFDEDERLELLEGVIIAMSPQGARHAHVVRYLTRLLVRAVGEEYVVCPQLPLTLGEDAEPEPDIAVVPAAEVSPAHHPRRAVLIVEVSAQSLEKDRSVKAALYASFGVGEYLIVNLEEGCIEVQREPDRKSGTYRVTFTIQPGDNLPLQTFPGVTLIASEVLGQNTE